jgi:8-oxo-dGTP pyrophosphatase MutT (NUDIX family)
MGRARVLSEEVIGTGNWISLKRLQYEDPDGKTRPYEMAQRTTRKGEVDGVGIVTIIGYGGEREEEIVLVTQFRPACGKEMVEVPAGLCDAGETTEEAALRELKEETGYVGAVTHVSPICFCDPGLSDTNMRFVFVSVDGTAPENMEPQPAQEEGEFIQIYTIPVSKLQTRLNNFDRNGIGVDARLLGLAMMLPMQGADVPRARL